MWHVCSKARILKPAVTPVAREQFCVHVVSLVTRKHAIIVVVFSVWPVPRLTRVEVGSNTSTVTLRVVGGDEKRSLIRNLRQ
jgi:hypothetical protein